MIVVCGGIKGGPGKTTVASNLAVLRARTHDVLLVDADEQESATIFTGIRKSEQPNLPQFTSVILRDEQVRRELDRLASRYDDVIIDTGGRDTRSQRAGLSIADQLLLPFNPRSLDIWTIENVEVLLHIAPFGRTLKYQGLYQGPDRCAVASYVPRLITCASS